MRLRLLIPTILPIFSALANAASVHLDVSHTGDVVIDVDDSPESVLQLHNDAQPTETAEGRTLGHSASKAKDYLVYLDTYAHQGFLSDDSTYVKFSNIRYAASPTKSRRFKSPEPYISDTGEDEDGSVERACPQVQPGWFGNMTSFLTCYINPLPPYCSFVNNWTHTITSNDYSPPYPGAVFPGTPELSEDCLLLDVYVPRAVWDDRKSQKYSVLTWIHGGGFIFGWKSQQGPPSGLLQVSAEDGGEPIIYVAFNYRLGAFGWSGGNYYTTQGGLPNAGLHDQVAAFEWIQSFIGDFGGNSSRVTVMGESAGASSILHHITSYEGDEHAKPLFNQAIMQSPAFVPQPDNDAVGNVYAAFQFNSGAYNLEALKRKDTKVLQEQNTKMNYHAKYGTFRFGPTVDGGYVSDLPGKHLREGKYHRNIPILAGHSFWDGLLFTPPWIRNKTSLEDHIHSLYPKMSNKTIADISRLYPISSGALVSGKQKIYEVSDMLDDVGIACNNYYLTERALESDSPVYRYMFAAPPAAIHSIIPFYLFYPADPEEPPHFPGFPAPNKDLSRYIQSAFINFVRTGNPNPDAKSPDAPWQRYRDKNRKLMQFGRMSDYSYRYFMDDDKEFSEKKQKEKCDFWQSAEYVPDESDHALANQRPGENFEL